MSNIHWWCVQNNTCHFKLLMAPDDFCCSGNYSSMNSRDRATLLWAVGLPLHLMWVARTGYTLPPKYMTHGFWLVRYQAMKDNVHVKVKVSLLNVRLFWNPVSCSLSGSSVHGIFQARIQVSCHLLLQWILSRQGLNLCLLHWHMECQFTAAFTNVSCIYCWITWEAHLIH